MTTNEMILIDKAKVRQALEALEDWKKGFSDLWQDSDEKAITALRQALEQELLESPVNFVDAGKQVSWPAYGKPLGILMKLEGDETMKLYPSEQQPVNIQVQAIISKLEPLLDAKNQSWAQAEAMLLGILEQQPCKYPKCPYPCPDLPDCKDAEDLYDLAVKADNGGQP